MSFIKTQKFVLIWLIFGIPLLSFLLLKKTFNLALYGDDWLQLYNLWVSFDVNKTLSFFDIKSYLSSYWPQYFFLGIIKNFFGYQPTAYFAASLILRILATFSLFFLSYELTKSRLAGFLTTLIFTFSTAGLETTDWVFNMNTYAGIFFLNLAIVFYLKIRGLKTFFSWYYLVFITLFTLALGVVPVRMHGAILFVLVSEIFLYIFFDKKNIFKIDKFLISRIVLPPMIMLMLVKAGSFVLGGEFSQLQTNFIYLLGMLQEGRYDILFYFLGTIGNFALPDTINTRIFSAHLLPVVGFFTLIGFLISLALQGNRLMYKLIIFFNILGAIIGKLLILWNPVLPFSNLFSILLGYQTLFLSFVIFHHTKKIYPRFATSIMIGLFWIISFSILYFLRTRFLIIDSTSRYMTMGAVGFSILFASFLTLMFSNFKANRFKFAFLPLLMLLYWLYINFTASQSYLNNLEINRNLALADKTWATLIKNVPTIDKSAPSVFYFTYDNSTAANMILIFGFSPHAGLAYGITTWDKTPLPTESYTQLLDMAKTGQSMQKIHAREAKAVPLNRIFAFDLRDGELINITDKIRAQLSADLNLQVP